MKSDIQSKIDQIILYKLQVDELSEKLDYEYESSAQLRHILNVS